MTQLVKPCQARNINAEMGMIQDHQLNNPHLPRLFPTEYHSPLAMGLGDPAFLARNIPSGVVGGWVELARTTLGSAASTITVSSLSNKRYYKMLFSPIFANPGSGNTFRTGNGTEDSGSVYARRQSTDGGVDSLATSSNTGIWNIGGFSDTVELYVGYGANLSAQEKLFQMWRVFGLVGSVNAPRRVELVAKWANTSTPLDIFQATLNTGGSFATGSELVILGWDPADTHTTNFWEELDSTDFSGSADEFTSSTFSARKYLWVQCYLEGTSSMRGFDVQFNSDTGTNYSFRRDHNGTSEATFVNTTAIQAQGGAGVTNIFWNMFIINNSANEKLCIIHSGNVVTQGAGTAPTRDEIVGKWDNTASQITSITVRDGDTGKITTGKLRVFGAN